jgi:enoyl-CoA hydratase/carnithine racemase
MGSGGSFSAGSDVAEFAERARGRADLSGPILDFIRQLALVEKPLIAAVDGLAVGVGTTLLFHCDLVYATSNSTFRTPFLDLGLVPEAGSSLLAPQRMGHARAFEMLALGETFGAERALAAGLVNAIVPAAELEAAALDAARRLAAKPPEALALCRRLMRGDTAAVRSRIEEEARIFAERLVSPEAREAFAAFLEKRPPDFQKRQ